MNYAYIKKKGLKQEKFPSDGPLLALLEKPPSLDFSHMLRF